MDCVLLNEKKKTKPLHIIKEVGLPSALAFLNTVGGIQLYCNIVGSGEAA